MLHVYYTPIILKCIVEYIKDSSYILHFCKIYGDWTFNTIFLSVCYMLFDQT